MALSVFNIARSVQAGGVAAGAAFLLVALGDHYGIPITEEQAAGLIMVVWGIVSHLVPDSKKQQVEALASSLNISVTDLAKMVPQIYEIYPSGRNGEVLIPNVAKGPSNSNINQ